MIKKLFLIIFIIIFIFIIVAISINTYKNSPPFISKILKEQINKTQNPELKNQSDWLWFKGRTFVFDVIYMNIFSPGTAKMQITGGINIENVPAYIIEANVEPGTFFKKIYDAKMVLSSAVRKDTKLPLWYNEESFTPEEKKSKKIVFDLENNIAEREGSKFKVPEKTYDPLAVFFNFLDSDFKIDETNVFKLLSKEDIYDFKITPIGITNSIYKLDGEVFRENRSSAHGAHFKIWVFDDGKVRVPLLIKVNSAGGIIYLRLKELK